VPVTHAVYRIVPPPDWAEGAAIAHPPGGVRGDYEGRRAVVVEQRPLREPAFVVSVSPGFVDAPATAATTRGPGPDLAFWLMVGVLAVVVVGSVIASAKRSKRKGQGGSSGGGGACAGASSCSSGCGGGGCGGGCGG
jgi:hypothetical protein